MRREMATSPSRPEFLGCRGNASDVHAGDGPVRSPTLGAYLVPVEGGRKLRIAEEPDGTRPWLTAEESERAAKEAALARVAELEAELGRRGK